MAISPKKRLRGKRARAHWRGRSRDLREHYRQSDLPPDLAIIEFEDAFGSLDPEAQLRQAVRADGAIAEGAPEWVVPERPKVRGVAQLKEDPLGRMWHRHMLERAQFQSGREYQRLYDMTQVALVRSIDLSKTKVSGGGHWNPLTDARQIASKKLRYADEALLYRHGVEGLGIVQDVLCQRRSVNQAGRLRGATTARQRDWFGALLRRCLSVLAVQFGFANSTRRPVNLNGHGSGNRFSRTGNPYSDGAADPALDPARHADVAELGDPALRRARANGAAH